MMNRILAALQHNRIEHWRVRILKTESAELFFVKKQLDTRRIKDVCKYEVTVFRDSEDGKKRGSNTVIVLDSDSDERIDRELAGAYYAASFAGNPMFDLPDPIREPLIEKTGILATQPLSVSAGQMTEALFAPDHFEDAFINSAEIFITRTYCHTYSSEGTDVSYTNAKAEGEYVVQCPAPEDVEMHHRFAYTELEMDALRASVAEALTFVRDRARAMRTLKSGAYDLLLSGDAVKTVLSYYTDRSDASMLYAHYSTWKCGDAVQGSDLTGEKLALSLCATVPYDAEGIRLQDLPLMQDGVLHAIHGTNRFCRYLNVKPTGMLTKLKCTNGSVPFAELKQGPCLWVVTFSDFQMDSFSGHFGGEIRLAYLIENGKVTPVTGGSVNGNLLEAQKQLTFSTERYVTASYDGPYAVRFSGIRVAGSDDGE